MSKVNIIIDQGTSFSTTVELTDAQDQPVNTAIYTARGQIRKHFESNSSTAFTTSFLQNELTISLTANQTSNLVAGRHVYDVELVDNSNNVIRLLEGVVTVTPEVTK